MSPKDTEAVDRAEALLDQGQAAAAAALAAGPARTPDASHAALATYATALKALGRRNEALPFNQLAAERFPASPVAWHNLAATLGDVGRPADSRAAAEKAMALGLDVQETWLVLARCWQAS